MSQFQILGRRPFPFKAISIRFVYTNFPDTISIGPLFMFGVFRCFADLHLLSI